ncbi:unnamed protein product [Caretta caretta]
MNNASQCFTLRRLDASCYYRWGGNVASGPAVHFFPPQKLASPLEESYRASTPRESRGLSLSKPFSILQQDLLGATARFSPSPPVSSRLAACSSSDSLGASPTGGSFHSKATSSEPSSWAPEGPSSRRKSSVTGVDRSNPSGQVQPGAQFCDRSQSQDNALFVRERC